MKNGNHVRAQKKLESITTCKRRYLRCMDVPIAVAADIKQNIFINMMMKKMQRKIRS